MAGKMNTEDVIKGLEIVWNGMNAIEHELYADYVYDALALIHEQQERLKAREWRRFEFREPTEEEKAEHPEWCCVIENTPDEGEILVSDGKYVWKDEFCNNGVECYLDSGHEMERCWWMPLPELPKEEDDALQADTKTTMQ